MITRLHLKIIFYQFILLASWKAIDLIIKYNEHIIATNILIAGEMSCLLVIVLSFLITYIPGRREKRIKEEWLRVDAKIISLDLEERESYDHENNISRIFNVYVLKCMYKDKIYVKSNINEKTELKSKIKVGDSVGLYLNNLNKKYLFYDSNNPLNNFYIDIDDLINNKK